MNSVRHSPDSQEPFELVQLLGVGGFAQTHLARVCDEDLIEDFGVNRVALKIPLNKKNERVLRRELEMNVNLHIRLRHLDSKNLVRYLGFAVFRGQIVMAMEYIREGSLRKVLGKVGQQTRMAPTEAVRQATGILEGLDAIHQERILHRDIKPENILMENGTPKIADFGISRMIESNELAGTATGTLYYMAPEILMEEGGSFPADVWSVGVTLYEMLTARLPFGGPGTPLVRMCELITNSEPAPPADICPGIPASLNDILKRALEKKPSRRFGSAAEMLQALRLVGQTDDQRIDAEAARIGSLLSEGRLPEAEESLQSLVAQYPRNAKAYQYLGEHYNRRQRYPDAVATFQSGIAVQPDNAILHWHLALAYQNMRRRTDAAASLEKAIAIGLDASLQRYAATLLTALRRGNP